MQKLRRVDADVEIPLLSGCFDQILVFNSGYLKPAPEEGSVWKRKGKEMYRER